MAVTSEQIAASAQYRTQVVDDKGQLTRSWTRHLQTVDVAIQNLPSYFFQPAAVRANTPPSKIAIGSIFYETDTTHVFISDGVTWRQIRP